MTDSTDARRIATILSIDIAGFSRASELDDVAAARHVQSLRTIVAERAAVHHGRVFNTAGDGLMLEFPTVADGVAGALDIAEAAAEARKNGLPLIRLGLHVGDVTVLANGDLIGAGVNVAARVQQKAVPGEILTTGDVRNLFATQSAAQFTRYGGAQLDKMARQVDLFALARPGFKARRTLVQRMRQNNWRMVQAGLAAAVALVMVAGAALLFRQAAPGGVSGLTQQNRQPVVAVAPFENLSGDQSLNYFSAGMTEEIQHAVSRIRGVRVVTRMSGFAGEASKDTTHVLSGSVRKNGDQVRVSAQLARATGEILWSESFERPVAETIAVQDEIAGRVARALSVVAPESAKSASIDPRAFELYLRGRDLWRSGGEGATMPKAAISDLEEAVGLAPKFARAWVALASAYAQRQNWATGDEQAALIQKARDAASRALEIDPALGEAYVVLGRFDPSKDWAVRGEMFAKAIAAEPNDPDVLMLYSDFWLGEIGQTAEASRQLAKAYEGDPTSSLILNRYVASLVQTGDIARVQALIAERQSIDETAGALWQNVLVDQLGKGDFAGARASSEKLFATLEKLAAKYPGANVPEAKALIEKIISALETKDPVKTDEVVAETMKSLDTGQSGAAQAIFDLALMGKNDLAKQVIDKLYLQDGYKLAQAAGPAPLPLNFPLGRVPSSYLMHPMTAWFRTDPMFWKIMATNGLARYWLDSGQWPDFCATIGTACKAEAEKALAAQRVN